MEIRTFSEYCKERFGTKVYRLSLSTGCSCPNRDGKVAFGGCTFCSEKGSGEFTSKHKSIDEQIENAKKLVDSKFSKKLKESERKYIAYFQSFTNTYGDTFYLKKLFLEAARREEIVAVSIATRPDCLEEDKLKMLTEINKIKPVWIELGLQTINDVCAEKFNRGYKTEIFDETYKKLKEIGLEVIVHVILGLPYETEADTLNTIEYLAKLRPPVDGVKLHLLHVVRGTKLAKEYEETKFKIMTLDEYADLVVKCLKRLPKEVVIHRLTGDGDKKTLIEPQWSGDKKRVLNTINQKIREAKS